MTEHQREQKYFSGHLSIPKLSHDQFFFFFLIENPLKNLDYFPVLSLKPLCKSIYNAFDFAKSQLCTHKVSLPPSLCADDGGAPAVAESPPLHKQVLCSHRWENIHPGGVWTFCSSKDGCGVINSSSGAIKERWGCD